jgi:hypothetical protein
MTKKVMAELIGKTLGVMLATLTLFGVASLTEGCGEDSGYSYNKERAEAMRRFPLVGRTQAWDVRLIDSCTVVLIPESGEQQPIIQKIR